MRHHRRVGFQIGAHAAAHLALYPRRTNGDPLLVFQRIGEIDHRAAGIARRAPVLASERFVAGKKSEIHVLELFGAQRLNEGGGIAHRFQLAERFIVIKQADVAGGEVALIQDFPKFLALEPGGANYGHAIQMIFCRSHGWGHSWVCGMGGGALPAGRRRSAYISRSSTPESIYASAITNKTTCE